MNSARHCIIILILANTFAAFGQPMKPPISSRINKEHPLATDLVGYWLMNEGGGKAIYDLSGNRNTGTFYGDTKWVPGKFGSCLSFDGNADYVNMGTLPGVLDNVSVFTISCWVNWPIGPGNYDIVLGKYSDSTHAVSLNANATGTYLAFSVCNGSTSYAYISDFVLVGVWYHLVFVFDGAGATNSDRLKIYSNGQQRTLTFNGTIPSATPSIPSTPFYLGYTSSTYCLLGLLDDVMIFNRVLTASEIQQLYREPFCMFAKPPIIVTAEAPPPPAGRRRVIIIANSFRDLLPLVVFITVSAAVINSRKKRQ